VLSPDKELLRKGGKTKIKYDEDFGRYYALLTKLFESPSGAVTIEIWNDYIFNETSADGSEAGDVEDSEMMDMIALIDAETAEAVEHEEGLYHFILNVVTNIHL
jgi:hypothetical protein